MKRNIGGRPFKKWAELGHRTKRLKVDNLAHNNPGECLSLAVIKAQKTVGCSSKVKSVKSENSQKSNEEYPIKMTTIEAISLKIQCDLFFVCEIQYFIYKVKKYKVKKFQFQFNRLIIFQF